MDTCNKCNREFNSNEKYNKHVKSNRCKEPYECKVCNYIVKRKSDYIKHTSSKKCIKKTKELEDKKEKESTFVCEGCNKSFRDQFNLQRHKQKKTPCNPSIIINNNDNSNNVYIQAHDPSAFIRNLNKVDKAMFNNMLGAHSINSPESIQRLTELAEGIQYNPPRLMDPSQYSPEEEEDIENANNEYRKFSNTRFLSKLFCKAFLDCNELEYAPFFRVPTSKKLKVKYDNKLHELNNDIVFSLIDSFIHKMEIVKKEKNIDLWGIEESIHKAYDDFRIDFLKLLKHYEFENKRIAGIIT